MKVLRISGELERPVSEVVSFLRAAERAYAGIYLFESLLTNEWSRRDFVPLPWRWPARAFSPIAPRDFTLHVKPGDELSLHAARFSSPGFWDFVAKVNPLEVLRHYLADRHERRKDRKYRERAEQQRLSLENKLLENKVLRERIEIARSMGATDADLIPWLNEYIHLPLRQLARHQDSGLIAGAEMRRLPSGDEDQEIDPDD